MSSDRGSPTRRALVGASTLVAVLAIWGALGVAPSGSKEGSTPKSAIDASTSPVVVGAANGGANGSTGGAPSIEAGVQSAKTIGATAVDDDAPPAPPPNATIVEGGTPKSLAEAGAARVQEITSSYLAAAAYPPTTRVVPAGAADPLASAAAPAHTLVPMADGSSLDLTFSSWSLTPGDALHIEAKLLDAAGLPIALRDGEAAILDTTGAGYHDKIALAATGAGVSASWLTPDEAKVSGDPGTHVVAVKITTADGTSYSGSNAVVIGVSHVHLTGHYQSRIVDGSLVFSAEVQVSKPTRAHLALTLASTTALDGPRVLAQKAERLDVGLHWIDVVAWGSAVRTLGDGPYVVAQLVLQDTSRMPAARERPVASAFVTPSYPRSAFRSDDFGQPDLVRLARFLEER